MPSVGKSRLLIANLTLPGTGKFFAAETNALTGGPIGKFIRSATIFLNNDAAGTEFTVTEPVGGGTAKIAKGTSLNLQMSGQMDTNQGSSFDITQFTFGGTANDVLTMIYED